ncbi:TPA: resolvase [Salmonella enterica subsp. enterica serovar Typhimurium]|nr:resolvase [Salmonella enterica subsp. enterica serovar Typhimurium]HDN5883358.1 resolvase [Salmonella enterica subsp. enterica serovar Typhimurium]
MPNCDRFRCHFAVYTKVFALDVAARHRVQFLMPESDAVTMLKNRHA